MTTLVPQRSSAPAGAPRPGVRRWFGRIARGIAVLAVVSAAATTVGGVPAQAAERQMIMVRNLGGVQYTIYGIAKDINSTRALATLELCGSDVNPAGQPASNCTRFSYNLNFGTLKGVVTSQQEVSFAGRRLADNQTHEFGLTGGAYSPPALPAGAVVSEYTQLRASNLGFRRYESGGKRWVQMWVPRNANVINGDVLYHNVNYTDAPETLRDRIVKFQQSVRAAVTASNNETFVADTSYKYMRTITIGGLLAGYFVGPAAVVGFIGAAAAGYFFAPTSYIAHGAMMDAVAAAADTWELMFDDVVYRDLP